MTRIPLLTDRVGLDPEQRAVFDQIASTRGAVEGPFAVLLRRPKIAAGAQAVGAYLRYESSLPADLRESVILATARTMGCAFEWDAHFPIAAKSGIAPEVLADIDAKRFDRLTGDIGLAVEFARALIEGHRVPQGMFDRVHARWGTDEVVELTSLVSYYTFLAMILNTFEVGEGAG